MDDQQEREARMQRCIEIIGGAPMTEEERRQAHRSIMRSRPIHERGIGFILRCGAYTPGWVKLAAVGVVLALIFT